MIFKSPYPDVEIPELTYPLIVRPKNEAVSFGLKIGHDETELREGAAVIFERFKQPVLVEQYIEGREVNVGILGNNPPEAFPPVELNFPARGRGSTPTRTRRRAAHAPSPTPVRRRSARS